MKHIFMVLTMFMITIVNAQEKITGIVTDTEGNTIPYVNIILSDTSTGTITNEAGIYSLNIPNLLGALEFSVLGYQTMIVPINNNQIINITLKESTEVLDEVVLTALGLKRETKELGYVVQSLDAEGITEVKSVNFL